MAFTKHNFECHRRDGGEVAHVLEATPEVLAAVRAGATMHALCEKINELLKCETGLLRAEGKCNELLCEVLALNAAHRSALASEEFVDMRCGYCERVKRLSAANGPLVAQFSCECDSEPRAARARGEG